MKPATLALIFFLNTVAAFSNSLDALVFDLSSDLKTTLPADGWVKFSFTVVNHGNRNLDVKFTAKCLESGKELAYYPHGATISLNSGEEKVITVFMNDQCGLLSDLQPGQHSRIIEYSFTEVNTRDRLVFAQPYIISVENR